MTRTITTKVWTDKIFGDNPEAKERGIQRKEDWRDGDLLFEANGNMTVEPRDRRTGTPDSPIEPDWKQGAYVQDRSTGQPVMVFEGEPPEFFKRTWREGRVLYGVLVSRDDQQHN